MRMHDIDIGMFKEIIKQTVKEALKEERLVLYDTLIPTVSSEEQAEIDSVSGSPEDYDETEFEDMTDWVLN